MTIKEVNEDYKLWRGILDQINELNISYTPLIKYECRNKRMIELYDVIQSIDKKYIQFMAAHGINNLGWEDLLEFIHALGFEEDHQTSEKSDPSTEIKLEVGKRYLIHNLYGITDPEKPSTCQVVMINCVSSNGRAARAGDHWFLIEKVDIIDYLD